MPSYAHQKKFILILWACLAMHTQSETITFRKLSCLSAGKKPTSSPLFSGDIATLCKHLFLCTFGYIQP